MSGFRWGVGRVLDINKNLVFLPILTASLATLHEHCCVKAVGSIPSGGLSPGTNKLHI